MRYFKVDWKAGLITHDDQEKDGLKFNYFGGMVAVEGADTAIGNWSKRTGAKEIDGKTYSNDKLTIEKAALEAEIVNLEAEKVAKESELTLKTSELTKVK